MRLFPFLPIFVKKSWLFGLAGCLLLLLPTGRALAQEKVAPPQAKTSIHCGTASPTPEEYRTMGQKFMEYARLQRLNRTEVNPLTYVPVRVVIFQKTDGTQAVSELDVLRGLMQANQRFRNINLQFYVCGSINYFVNDTHFDMDKANEGPVVGLAGQVTGVANLYFPNSIVSGGNQIGGFAYYPNGVNGPERLFVVGSQAADGKTTPHEFGHYFSLLHTFENANNATISERELVTRGVGANCVAKGDQLCDTPADPYGRAGGDTYANCAYTGGLTDANGDAFTPDPSNIMGYLFNCGNTFSPGQMNRMETSWIHLADRAYTATGRVGGTGCGSSTLAASPVLSSPISCGSSGLTLTWTDIAGDAGYFIERSVDGGNIFNTVGAVTTGITSFTDDNVASNANYVYRIKPANSSANLSNTVSVTSCVVYCTPSHGSPCQVSGTTTLGIGSFSTTGGTTNLNNANSGCSPNGYGDFSAQSGTFAAGSTINYTINFTIGSGWFFQTHAIWIDFNNNGVFEGSAPGVGSEMVAQDNNATGPSWSGSFTIPAGAVPGSFRMRVRSNSSSPAAAVTNACANLFFGESEDYTVNLTSTSTWNGATWSPMAPVAASNVVLAANYPNGVAGQGSFSGQSLTVNSGTTLTVGTGQTVTVNGALTYSGATIAVLTGGSFVQGTGSTSITSNAASRFRAVRTDGKNAVGYNFISSPVGGETFNSIGVSDPNPNFRFRYNPTAAAGARWVAMAGADVLTRGVGYTFIPGSAANNTLTFENTTDGVAGQPGNGNLSVPLTFGGDNFNLIGNPYPSPIGLQAFLAANTATTSGTAWIWNDNNNSTGTGAYVAHNNVTPAIEAAVGQGFFVQATGAGSVNFTNALRVGANPTFFRGEEQMERFLLRVNDAQGNTDQVWAAFGSQFTAGFERGYDAEKFEGVTDVSIAARVNGERLAIAALPQVADQPLQLPITLLAKKAGAYTFAAQPVDGPTSKPLFLEDRQTGNFYLLQLGRAHTLDLLPGNYQDRFFLRSASEVAGPAQASQLVAAYAFGQELFVEAAEVAEVTIYSLMGQPVQRFANLQPGSLRRLNSGVPVSGVYVVRVATASGTTEKRVWLEK
jgi:GEVED domain/Pregnancy-associated plasma protein-A